MMSTERRLSAVAPSASPTSRSAINKIAAIPRDLQRPGAYNNAGSSITSPDSPDRKRHRFSLGNSNAQPISTNSFQPRPEADQRSHDDGEEEEMDELDETNDRRKRQRSDSGGAEHKAQGRDGLGRNPVPQHSSWTGRSASASLEHMRHREHVDIKPPGFPRRSDLEGGAVPFSRYEQGYGGSREEGGRHIGGLVGDRYAADNDPRDRLAGPGDHKGEQSLLAQRMPPPSSIDSRSPTGLPQRLPSLHHRASSPPPRLPGFASLESEGMPARLGREEAGMGPGVPYSTSPRRSLPFRPPAYAGYPPSSSRTPIMHHHPSPTPSTSYGNPPMIHPSLAGLPGAGGGPGGKQQPSFVSKLYSMLEDPSISDLISWGPSGTVFSVANPAEFSRLVLPNWFKHSNWQSFVRQLNMYGFHKVNHSYQGNPTDEVQVWEFRHPSFRRGEIALLNDIKRKSSRQKRSGSPRGSISGADLRADRSGGSPTPSPEVPLATIPGGPDAIRMGMGMHRGSREFMYGDDRMMDAPGFDRRPDPRAYGADRVYANDYGYNRAKMEGHSGVAGGIGAPTAPGAPAAYPGEERRVRPDPYLDRGETAARFEDLSERTDAIIRHASFLESQVRILSDQLNESRAMTHHLVCEEMMHLLDRMERALSAPAPPGIDVGQKMLDVVRSQLSYYSQRSGPVGGDAQDRGAKAFNPGASVHAQNESASAGSKRPSV